MNLDKKQYAHISNPCSGCYGKCLDVKISNNCNGHCSFCIEKDGYQPDPVSVEKMIQVTKSLSDYQTVLILGGEPFLYPHLSRYLRGIKTKNSIYITTNGTCFEHQSDLNEIASILTGINISLQHYDKKINDAIVGAEIDFSYLRKVIKLFQQNGAAVRINCNLTRHGIRTIGDIFNMIERTQYLGANEIRFAELQNASDDFVSAKEAFGNLFGGLHIDPFSEGCEQVVYKREGFRIIIRQTCGIVNPLRDMPENPIRRGSETMVLYPDGELFPGWLSVSENDAEDKVEYLPSCHKKRYEKFFSYSDGCHKNRLFT